MTRTTTRAAAAIGAALAAATLATAAPATATSTTATSASRAGDKGTGLTYDALVAMFGSGWVGDRATVEAGLPSLQQQMTKGGITNASRKAAFLATLVSESAVKYNADEWGSTYTYRGRGYIQLTGDFNYKDAGTYFGINLLGNPDLAKSLRWSAPIARWYWTVARTTTNAYADAHDMNGVNRNIGFAWSYDEATRRCSRFKSAFKYFTGYLPKKTICYPARLPKPGSTDWYVHPERGDKS
jgi:predicted chitinase